MSNELTTLSTLAVEINLLNEQVEHHKNQAVIYAARTGVKLNEVKEGFNNDSVKFIEWLKNNCTVQKTHAYNFIRLAKEMPHLLEPSFHSSGMGLKQAIELLSAPEEVKAEVTAKIEAGEDVTVKEIQRLKKEAAEAKEKLDAANKRQMDLSVKLDSKQEEIATLVNQKWILENQQAQIIDAKVSEGVAKAITENQRAKTARYGAFRF